MNISCEIIKDLLPLYQDGVCSEDTKVLVERHIAECSDCREELEAMRMDFLPETNQEKINEAESLFELSRKWKYSLRKSLFEGAIGTLAIVVIVIFIIYVFLGIQIG